MSADINILIKQLMEELDVIFSKLENDCGKKGCTLFSTGYIRLFLNLCQEYCEDAEELIQLLKQKSDEYRVIEITNKYKKIHEDSIKELEDIIKKGSRELFERYTISKKNIDNNSGIDFTRQLKILFEEKKEEFQKMIEYEQRLINGEENSNESKDYIPNWTFYSDDSSEWMKNNLYVGTSRKEYLTVQKAFSEARRIFMLKFDALISDMEEIELNGFFKDVLASYIATIEMKNYCLLFIINDRF